MLSGRRNLFRDHDVGVNRTWSIAWVKEAAIVVQRPVGRCSCVDLAASCERAQDCPRLLHALILASKVRRSCHEELRECSSAL